jgi:hypothetical protein
MGEHFFETEQENIILYTNKSKFNEQRPVNYIISTMAAFKCRLDFMYFAN